MSSTSIHNSQGIQILLEAEKEAKKIISDGREYRTRRLKEAKIEAMQEINALKESKKQEVITTERKYAAMLQETVITEEARASKLITESAANFELKKDAVMEMLLKAVSDVSDLHPHKNWSSKK